MTVLKVNPNNPLHAGVVLTAFSSTARGDTHVVDAILITRVGSDFPVGDDDMPRLAKAFEAGMNEMVPPVEKIVHPGHAVHFRLSDTGDVLYLHGRESAGSQTAEGAVSIPGIEIRIMGGVPGDVRDDLKRKMKTPTVIQSVLDVLQSATGPQPRQDRGMVPSL